MKVTSTVGWSGAEQSESEPTVYVQRICNLVRVRAGSNRSALPMFFTAPAAPHGISSDIMHWITHIHFTEKQAQVYTHWHTSTHTETDTHIHTDPHTHTPFTETHNMLYRKTGTDTHYHTKNAHTQQKHIMTCHLTHTHK